MDLKPCELLEHPELWIIHYWGQSAAKPQKKLEEGSTTIESIGANNSEEVSRVGNSISEVQGPSNIDGEDIV